MQVYKEWRLLSARPSLADERSAPHRLFGHRSAALPYSVGVWINEVEIELQNAFEAGNSAIIVGGTGLSFRALTEGLAPIPAIPDDIRTRTEAMYAELGADAFRAALLERDPSAAALDIENPRRAQRAWEVLDATGRSLADWMGESAVPVLPASKIIARAVLSPDRDVLAARIEERLGIMIAEGVLNEVEQFEQLRLDPALPGTRAIGAATFAAHLRGDLSLPEATERVAAQTRQYAKRQRTWYRNQLSHWPLFDQAEAAESHLFSGRA